MLKKSLNTCIIFSLIFLNACQVFNTNEYSKYGTSTQGIQLKQLPIDKLEKGMHKNEVIRLLGSPQSNPFTPNTWKYLYIEQGKKTGKIVTITFKKGRIVSIIIK